MLAMYSLFSSSFEFPLEDHKVIHDHHINWQSVNDSFRNFKDDHDHKTLQNLGSFGSSSPLENYDQVNNNTKRSSFTSSDPTSSKKLNHNASERDRRKKLNDLYSTLRSLLPLTDQKKKLSIPSSITQALKYIPQLQNQVEKLVQRKEEILSCTSKKQNNVAYHPNKKSKQCCLPNVAVNAIDDNEIVVQICTTKINRSHHFSSILQSLEKDELQILNASTFASCEDKVFYTLHVQVKKTQRMECEMLSDKILSLC